MKLSLKWLAVLTSMLMISACSSDNASTGGADGDGDSGSYKNDPRTGQPITPGSASDFEANVGDRVFFGYDSSVLTSEGQETLERQAAWLKQYGDYSVTVEGHCDERGTREYNIALGERRATAAKDYLVSLGVDSSRVRTLSYGKERPAVLGSDDESYAQNRRAVTVIE